MCKVADIITAYRIKAYDHAPYISPYVYSLRPVEKPGLGTMAVDKAGRMYYDPAFCDKITMEEGAYVVLHESWHLILRHCHLAEEILGPSPSAREKFLYNVCVDLVVWELMIALKDDAPKGCITLPLMQAKYPGIVPNMDVGALYRLVMEQEKSQPEEPEEQPEEEEEDSEEEEEEEEEEGEEGEEDSEEEGEEEEGDSEPEEEGEGDEGEEGEADKGKGKPGEGDADNDGGKGNTGGNPIGGGRQTGESAAGKGGIQPEDVELTGGSAADGQERDYEEEDDGTWDGFQESNLLEAIEKKVVELEDNGWVGGRGSIPAGLKRVLKERLHPSINPWDRLRATVGRAAASNKGVPESTYARPSRRGAGLDVRLKGHKNYSPNAVVIVDTSGSMSRECLAKAIVVIKQGLRSMPSVRVITCDASVTSDRLLTAAHREFELCGGGGTDMRVPIEYAQKKYHPDVTVLVTDCDTPWPAEKIKGKLIVAATQDGRVPDWAIKVRIPDKQEEGFNG